MTRALTAAELVEDPGRVVDLDPAAVPGILAQLTALTAAVAARLRASEPVRAAGVAAAVGAGDRLLTVGEASGLTGMSKDWLYRSDAARGFRVKMGSDVRFSYLAIQRFIERQRGR